MITIWIRIDGVIGDVLSEFNRYFNLFRPMGYECRESSVDILRARSLVTTSCQKLTNFIPTQPEPYRDMKILPECLKSIKIMRNLGWDVKLFTDEVQRREKEVWGIKNIPADEVITWIKDIPCPPLPPDYIVVIDHEFHIRPYRRMKHEIVFYPYSLRHNTLSDPGVYTWSDDWEKKIRGNLSQQGLKDNSYRG